MHHKNIVFDLQLSSFFTCDVIDAQVQGEAMSFSIYVSRLVKYLPLDFLSNALYRIICLHIIENVSIIPYESLTIASPWGRYTCSPTAVDGGVHLVKDPVHMEISIYYAAH